MQIIMAYTIYIWLHIQGKYLTRGICSKNTLVKVQIWSSAPKGVDLHKNRCTNCLYAASSAVQLFLQICIQTQVVPFWISRLGHAQRQRFVQFPRSFSHWACSVSHARFKRLHTSAAISQKRDPSRESSRDSSPSKCSMWYIQIYVCEVCYSPFLLKCWYFATFMFFTSGHMWDHACACGGRRLP